MGGLLQALYVVLAGSHFLQQPFGKLLSVFYGGLSKAECFTDLSPMVLGRTAAVVIASVLRCRRADLARDIFHNLLVDLFGSREASIPGEEPENNGETEPRGTFSADE